MKIKDLSILSDKKYPNYKLKGNVFIEGLLTIPTIIPTMVAQASTAIILHEIKKGNQKVKHLDNKPLKYNKSKNI